MSIDLDEESKVNTPAAHEKPSDQVAIDHGFVDSFFNGDTALIEKMRCVFLATYDTSESRDVADQLWGKKSEEIQLWLHTLKSSANYVGAVSLSQHCATLEVQLRQDEQLEEAALAQVRSQLAEVIEELRRC